MEKSSWPAVYQLIGSLPKKRRYSVLTEPELRNLWNEVSLTISMQMLNKRLCSSVPYLGRFLMGHPSPADGNNTGFVPHFIPAHNFSKIPGLNLVQHKLTSVPPTEIINYSTISSNTQFTRDEVELGMKDIVLGMSRFVRSGKNAVFPFQGIGKLLFRNGQIRLKYYPAFCAAMNAAPMETNLEFSIQVEDGNAAESTKKLDYARKQPSPGKHDAIHPPEETSSPNKLKIDANGKPPAPPTAAFVDEDLNSRALHLLLRKDRAGIVTTPRMANLMERLKATVLASDVSLPFIQADIEQVRRKADVMRTRSASVVKPPEGMHLHSNSGNRFWQDGRCPVCRAKANLFVDLREESKRKEKEFDKMVTKLSMEIDEQLAAKEKLLQEEKTKVAKEAAQYNWKTILEKEAEKKAAVQIARDSVPLIPRELHARPRKLDLDLAEDLKCQIAYHREQIELARKEKESEDRMACDLAATELKRTEMKNHLEGLRRKQSQRNALISQIHVQKQRQDRERYLSGVPFHNDFVHEDIVSKAAQTSRTKTLLEEQIAILKIKRDVDRQKREQEKANSKKLLQANRDELNQDLLNLRREKWEARKTLETFWRDQAVWKEQLLTAYQR